MLDFSVFAYADAWVALLTLTVMEIVLGIDNIVFISILTEDLPEKERPRARTIGLALAMISRLGLLFAISWLMGLTEPLFTIMEHSFSGRDLILGGGGLFLLAKATSEIFEQLEVAEEHKGRSAASSFTAVIIQILILDIVFSLDSVITAVGMADQLVVMAAAVIIAVIVMLVAAGPISAFISKNPSMKILALAFLLMIGVMLVAEGAGQHINKGYIYFAMAFAMLVELVNMRMRRAQRKIPEARVET
jgi:predicted tellurium resistance membrane protein TerC